MQRDNIAVNICIFLIGENQIFNPTALSWEGGRGLTLLIAILLAQLG